MTRSPSARASSGPSSSGISLRAELGLLLRLAHQRAAKAFTDALQPLGLESRHFGVLMTLARLGPLPQARLVVELNNDKSTMMRTVDDLERLGLIERRPVPGDRRSHTVGLTAAGRHRTGTASGTADAVSGEIFGRLSTRDQHTLRELLLRIIETE
jgi:MarR family transcriptional regulator, lower aerobic nicotinate degradation pathway regulator